MALSLDDIIAGANEYAGDDKDKAKELATALRERAKPVAQVLLNIGSALKKEDVKADIEKLKSDLAAMTEERDELVAAKSAQPDAAKEVAELKERHAKKIAELKEQIAAKDTTLRGALKKGTMAKFVAELVANGADPEWAEQIGASKYGALIDVKEDGSVAVKSPDGLEYDGDEGAKVKAFATDVGKLVPPKFRLTNADSGAGVRSGGGGSAYDAAKEGREMGEREKAQASSNKLAFT